MPTLKLSEIVLDREIQQRERLDEDRITEYAECVDELPPVLVFFDGSTNWLAAGFHRFHAHRRAGIAQIEATVQTGTKRDAILFAVGDNAAHGLPRNREDKTRAVKTLLDDEEWGKKATEWIAETAKVSWSFADKLRKDRGTPEKVTTRAGKEVPSRQPSRSKPKEEPSILGPETMEEDHFVDVNKMVEPAKPPKSGAEAGGRKSLRFLPEKIGKLVRQVDSLVNDIASDLASHGESIRKEHEAFLDASGALLGRIKEMCE